MFKHSDDSLSRVVVKFSTTQDVDDLTRDLIGCTFRAGHSCLVESATIITTRVVKLSNKLPVEADPLGIHVR
jgi:hypothetical protein